MPNVLSIWQNSPKRSRGIFAGCLGLASLLFTLAPVWDSPADAAITQFEFGPGFGVAGTAVGFSAPECIETGIPGVPDVAFEINTAVANNSSTPADESARDIQGFDLQADGIYGDDPTGDPPYVAPPEFDFLEPPASSEGPTYDVIVYCFTADGGDEGTDPDFSFREVNDGFTYVREATTTSTAPTTTSTAPTTTSTAPGSTTSTAPSSTTSTAPSSTTSTVPGSTTSTAPSSTTSTVPGSTTSTAPGSTTSTAPSSTTSSTAPGSTTSSTAPGSTTSSTAPGSTTSSTTPDSTTSTAPSTSSTTAGACTVADTTLTVGQSVGVSCGGFAPGSNVAVDLLSTPVRLATLTANANGTVTGTVQVPLGTSAGAHEIRFTGTTSDGTALVRSVAVTVSRQLPRTGDETWTIFRFAVLLLGLGLLAVGRGQIVAARR